MQLFAVIFLSIFGMVLLALNILLLTKTRRLENLFKDPGTDANDKIVTQNIAQKQAKLDKDVQDLYEINSKIDKVAKRGISKVGVARFNALGEKSGNKSFAIALLNYNDSGIILSNLQTNNGSHLFIRHIHHGDETDGVKLLDEELKALERAKQTVF